ncbi:MAG TPA: hypothetical protein VH351_17770 [Bryobacteraceae bacterium]|nr:hypothetical protein [Bryobacteraceae bacterium]
MSKLASLAFVFLTCAATLSSKDKSVPYQQMVLGMRDAFNCGVVVEQHLHGRLKDNVEAYNKELDANNCDHVQAVLATLHDQSGPNPSQ